MADWSWPGAEGAPADEPIAMSLADLAALYPDRSLDPRQNRTSAHPAAEAEWNAEEHLPYGHTTGQHVLDPAPQSYAEELLRRKTAERMVQLLDLAAPEDERDEALRWLMIEDPARAIGMLATLITVAWQVSEQHHGMEPGSNVANLKQQLEQS